MGKMRMEFHFDTARTPGATKCRHYFQHHATETRSGVRHIGIQRHRIFLVEGAPVANLKIVEKPIIITLPNGRTIRSTHTCNLDIPWLPDAMPDAHIVPGLAHSSLISPHKFVQQDMKSLSINKNAESITRAN